MSVLSYHLIRTTNIGSLRKSSVIQRSCSCLGWRKDLSGTRSTQVDKHQVFTVSKRTLIKKRQLIDTVGSSHLKAEYKKDKVGREFEFIYCSSNVRLYVWWTPMIFIVTISILVMCANIVRETHWSGKQFENVELKVQIVDTVNPLTSAYVLLAVMMVVLGCVFRGLGTVLLRLYYNKSTNEFIAILLKYGLYRKKMHFKPSDVVRLDKLRLKGNVIIKGIPLTVSESNFTSTPAYNTFMGYDISRPSAYKEQKDREDILKTMEAVKNVIEKKRKDEFLEKYKEKRKQRQLKDR